MCRPNEPVVAAGAWIATVSLPSSQWLHRTSASSMTEPPIWKNS
jgi:hypothetical protein